MRSVGDELLDFAGALLGVPACAKCGHRWSDHSRDQGCPVPGDERKADA